MMKDTRFRDDLTDSVVCIRLEVIQLDGSRLFKQCILFEVCGDEDGAFGVLGSKVSADSTTFV